jgi:hypothetical protein
MLATQILELPAAIPRAPLPTGMVAVTALEDGSILAMAFPVVTQMLESL